MKISIASIFALIVGLQSNFVASFKPTKSPLQQPNNNNKNLGDTKLYGNSAASFSVNSSPASRTNDPNLPPYKLNKPQQVYIFLSCLFVTCLIVSDVIGVKIFEMKLPFSILGHKTVEHTCGMLTFPITFILGDLINEYYGAKATKNTVYLGLFMSILVFFIINFAQSLPYLDKAFNVTPAAFDMVFGSAKLMYIASIIAYLVGQLSDIWLFGIIKRVTKGRYLWLRATGSTVISQLIDSFLVSYISFRFGKSITNQIPATMTEVFNIAITGYTLKFVIAGLMTPLLYISRNFFHKYYELEALPIDYTEDDE